MSWEIALPEAPTPLVSDKKERHGLPAGPPSLSSNLTSQLRPEQTGLREGTIGKIIFILHTELVVKFELDYSGTCLTGNPNSCFLIFHFSSTPSWNKMLFKYIAFS